MKRARWVNVLVAPLLLLPSRVRLKLVAVLADEQPLAHTRICFQGRCTIPDPTLNRSWRQVKALYRSA